MVIGSTRERALIAAGWSLLYPGLGQASQGRSAPAARQSLAFTTLGVAGLLSPASQWAWWGAAALVGVYSIVDAYRRERG